MNTIKYIINDIGKRLIKVVIQYYNHVNTSVNVATNLGLMITTVQYTIP